jgi:exopolyphosphatase/guanosine-5'-triphosphate,3'-diphosphate pyrophosphatase
LRLAQALCRGRSDEDLPKVKVSEHEGTFHISLSKEWTDSHPLTEFSLQKEAAEWERVGRSYKVSLK